MNKIEYLIAALQAKTYIKRSWIISCFASIKEAADWNTKNPYPYKLGVSGNGYVFLNEELEVVKITGSSSKKPLLTFKDEIKLLPGTFENVTSEIDTSVGRAVYNALCITHNFGGTIPFQTGVPTVKAIEKLVAPLLVDNPPVETDKVPGKITVHQYLGYLRTIHTIESLTSVFVHAATPKNILPPTGINAYRKKLLAEYGDRLDDPVVAVEFENKLREYDDEYLKDDPSLGIFMSGKAKNKARVKMHMAFGAEADFDGKSKYVSASLDGDMPTDKETHAELMSSVRAASFGRGNMTAISGTTAKELSRATVHIDVVDGDCGTKRTLTKTVHPGEEAKFVGMYYLNGQTPTLIETIENAKGLTGKIIEMRSAVFCIKPSGEFCRVCAGENLHANKGVSLATTGVTSTIMALMMTSIHGVQVSSAKIDLERALGI